MNDVSKKVNGLGLRIAQCRTKLGLSQSDISNLIGISRPNYTTIENETNKRFLKDYQLKAIASTLNVSSDYLLGLISDPNPNADMMSIINVLGLSSSSIKFIKSLNSRYHLNSLHTLDNFIESSTLDFWELLYLYKRVKSFFHTQYSFVIEFTEDIRPERLNVLLHTYDDIFKIEPNHKYYYYNLDDAKKMFDACQPILKNSNHSRDEKLHKIINLLDTGICTENYIYLYQDKSKLDKLKNDLEKIKQILHELIFILDFDETGLIFGTANKEEELCKYINKLLELINCSSSKDIDNEIEDLHSCLFSLNETISYSLTFIKYRINDTFNNYLEQSLDF